MAKVNVKEIMKKAKQMNDAWVEGAPTVEFGGVTQEDLAADINGVESDEAELDDILTRADIVRARIEDRVRALGAKRVRVGNGVRADPDYGTDSPLYGAMGFVRDSERASGLTRKKK